MSFPNIPRWAQIEKMTPEERAIYDLINQIEELGAHPLLTDVVVKLADAQVLLSKWVDQNNDSSPA